MIDVRRARWAALFALLALAACGRKDPPAVPSDRIVEVDKPVAVQPITPADVPSVPAPLGPPPPTLQQQADTLLGKVCEWVAYGLKANPALRLSAGEPAQALQPYPECERRP